MSLDQDLRSGAQAESLLSNPAFKKAIEEVEQTIHEAWAACPVRDVDGAHQLRLMLKALTDVRGVLESCVDNGNAARIEIERLRKNVLSPREWKGNL